MCEWVKGMDNQGNMTYVKDDCGFLTMNIWHRLPFMVEPFIFPSQVISIFIWWPEKTRLESYFVKGSMIQERNNKYKKCFHYNNNGNWWFDNSNNIAYIPQHDIFDRCHRIV
jgi:hypothetical protein